MDIFWGEPMETRRTGRLPWGLAALIAAAICALSVLGAYLIRQAFDRLSLSARSYHRLLRTARTIADLGQEERVREEHILEALGYRPPDRNEWMREG